MTAARATRAIRAIRISLPARVTALALSLILTALLLMLGLQHWLQDDWLAAALAAACMLPVTVFAVRSQLQPLLAIFRALGGTVNSYQDADYSFSLHWGRNDEVGDLVDAHNALGTVLRKQRLDLVQRELLLDTMVQNTPVAMLLVSEQRMIVFANIAARQLLNAGKRLEGLALNDVLDQASGALREAVARGGDGLFTASRPGTSHEQDNEDEIYHLARRNFTLNGRHHELLLLRHLTAELRRQEVQTWKKVIRVISHELNNSLAPIASLAASGTELVRRAQTGRLPEILKTIEDRTRHLERFIDGYARFAKLPAPRIEPVDWTAFVAGLQSHTGFTLKGRLPDTPGRFDVAQMEQALLNLLKNAQESGSAPQKVSMEVRAVQDMLVIEVADRGSGMSDTVMANALVPFYSTKRSGTGLGLALAREIIEAHGGRITIHNREAGGVSVALILPA
jgi:two-component system nitrogen regulation sensor histidine kinase NtrY